ncbi:MAG: endonuclease/exonuclease/phosphatase family protein [Candidatus Promineifilaceae bacterium]
MRVLTYNLWFGGRKRLDAIQSVLAHCRPDFAGLTEADDPDVVAELARPLEMQHVWSRGSGERHIAALSRHPIRSHRVFNRRPLNQAVLETRLEIKGRNGAPDEEWVIYTAHLVPYLLLPFEFRRWQAAGALLALTREVGRRPHLIIGDLNAIGPGDRVLQRRNPARMRRVMALQLGLIFRLAIPRLLRAGYVDCFRRLNPTADGFTWWTQNPTTRYDYVLAPEWLASRLRSCQVVADHPAVRRASDHFPLLAEFEPDPGAA